MSFSISRHISGRDFALDLYDDLGIMPIWEKSIYIDGQFTFRHWSYLSLTTHNLSILIDCDCAK
jgi:hypothetical protein